MADEVIEILEDRRYAVQADDRLGGVLLECGEDVEDLETVPRRVNVGSVVGSGRVAPRRIEVGADRDHVGVADDPVEGS
ncbi:MAG: hypothetical protein IPK07_06070 [Deltaproteobacteria bacterium]|jgi:hypothetical protein|nr:hypothetical protein [Deltaproteobacteria bacterium]